MLKMFVFCAMLIMEAEMKDLFLKKGKKVKRWGKRHKMTCSGPEELNRLLTNLSSSQLETILKRDKKFFSISAELSVNSN